MTQIDSYNHRVKIIEEEWEMHNISHRRINNALKQYYDLTSHHVKQLNQVVQQLDLVSSIFYKPTASKLASYLDTVSFQTTHSLTELSDLLHTLTSKFKMNEIRKNQLLTEYKKRKSEAYEALQALSHASVKGMSLAGKPLVDKYNQTLHKYQQSNDTLIHFRKEFNNGLPQLMNDETTRFFIFQLEKLRNNQFDIDQILKKSQPQQIPEFVQISENIQWRQLNSMEVTSSMLAQHTLIELQQKITADMKQCEVANIFDVEAIDQNISKVRSQLHSKQFQEQLKKVLLLFKNFEGRFNLESNSFLKLHKLLTAIYEFSIENLRPELLDCLLIFSTCVSKMVMVSMEKQCPLWQVKTVFDELRSHDYQKEEYWSAIAENVLRNYESEEREEKMQKIRKCLRKLGISLLEQHKQKRRIFAKKSQQ